MNGEAPEGVEIVNGSQCNVCGADATIHDLEYDEYFCDEHGESYRVMEGPHERLATHEEGEPPPEDPKPWTITLEITIESRGAGPAQREGMRMLEHIVSGWDGAAGAVMNVEPNFDA